MRLPLASLLVGLLALGAALFANFRTAQSVDELRAAQRELERELAALQGSAGSDGDGSTSPLANPAGARVAARGAVRAPRPGTAPGVDSGSDAFVVDTDRGAANATGVLGPAAELPAASLDEAIARFESRFGLGRVEALHELTPFAKRGEERAHQAIVQALDDDDPRVREEALDVAEELGDPTLLPHMAEMLDDPVAAVREELADALEEMPMREAGPLLLALLEDRSADVVAEAAESLGTRAWRPALPELEGLLDDTSLDVVAEAAAALRSLGENEKADAALDRVAAGVRSPDAQERREALYRVRQVGGPRARSYYEEALRDPEPDIRQIAREGLEKLGR